MSHPLAHPRFTEVCAYLDACHEDLRAVYQSMPPAMRATRPAPDRWSADDILAHLIILDRRFAALFTARLRAAREAGLGPETDASPILPHIDLTRVLDRRERIAAPAVMHPEALGAPASWEDYDRARAELKRALELGDGFALLELHHPHPVLGPVDFYAWIALIGAHAARHGEQMREVAAELTSS